LDENDRPAQAPVFGAILTLAGRWPAASAGGRVLLSASISWKAAHPGAVVGALGMSRVANPETSPALDAGKEELETRLRSQFSSFTRRQLNELPSLQPYVAYYKAFGKSYHVALQLESVVFKNRPIPRVAALVEAMFMAELNNLILTAGHDWEAVQGHVRVDVAKGGESYVTPNGQTQPLKQNDMFIHDDGGVLSSVLYGPAHRARITAATTRALFTAYAPKGIGLQKVVDHLGDLKANVVFISPEAEVEALEALLA
jgi:DNA/RNA-binding domain of Phe-tRNA-synthetase-like protein